MSEIGDFSKPLSKAISTLCKGYIINFKSYAFKIKEIIPEAVTTSDTINNFVSFNLKLLRDPNLNSLWKDFETESYQGFALVTPKKVKLELYPHTFVCSNPECRRLYHFEKIPYNQVLCKNCNSPLKQFNLILVCRNCGAIKEVFTKCPWCSKPIRVSEQYSSLHWECTNPECNASESYAGNKKINSYMRRFDRVVNIYRRPHSHLCLNTCHENSQLDWPLFQTRPREKIFSSYQDNLVKYTVSNSGINEIFPTKDDMQARGFEDISAGTLEIHSFVFGYTRFAKFEDRLRESKLRITPFRKEGGGINVYYNKIVTSGIRLKLIKDVVEEITQSYSLFDLSSRDLRGVNYIINEVKAEWSNLDPQILKSKRISLNETDILEEAAKRIILHTIKHALLVVAPRFCGLDYGEIGGYYKTPGMLREGDKLLEDYSIYIYDNTNYGSGVTFSLASNEGFLRWLDDPRDSARTRLECLRNRCDNACRACLYLPHTVCRKINLGLDRHLAKKYFESTEKKIELF